MAQEYILLNKNEDGNGLIALSKAVFETITRISLDELDDVYSVDKKESKAIQCRIRDNKLNVLVNVKIKYGANVNKTCQLLQEKIHENIFNMTNLKCSVVDIKINGFVI